MKRIVVEEMLGRPSRVIVADGAKGKCIFELVAGSFYFPPTFREVEVSRNAHDLNRIDLERIAMVWFESGQPLKTTIQLLLNHSILREVSEDQIQILADFIRS